jgi:hypothetical protein
MAGWQAPRSDDRAFARSRPCPPDASGRPEEVGQQVDCAGQLPVCSRSRLRGAVTISKPDFACALADRMLAEVSESPDNDEAIEALRRRRPGHLDLTAIISRGITPCDRQPQALAQIPSPHVPADQRGDPNR